jgi:ATP-dependent helicase/nuclease subunit A
VRTSDVFAFRRNLVLAASAGTGKTHHLVGVLIHAMLGLGELGGEAPHPPVAPDRIVATTFSRRAAGELRARLGEELEALAGGEDGSYGAALRAAAQRLGVRADVARSAREALAALDDASLGTLHSLAQSIVRAHAIDAGLAPGFRLTSEEEERALVRGAIEATLDAWFDREETTLAELLRAAGSGDALVDELARVLATLDEDGRGALGLVATDGDREVVERLFAELVELARAMRDERPAAAAFLRALSEGDDAGARAAARALPVGMRADKKVGKAPLLAFVDAIEELPHGASRAAKLEWLVGAHQVRARWGALSNALVRLVRDCEALVVERHRAGGTLGFGGLLRAARDLLRDRPDVAADVGAGIDVLMVDEFQDTSRVQTEIVRLLWARDPLRRRSGTIPAWDELRPSGLLVVGDRKQSIYGFRGADVAVFSEFCVGLAGEAARVALDLPPSSAVASAPVADFHALRENYRAVAPLLELANAFSAVRLRGASSEPFEARYVAETEALAAPPRACGVDGPRAVWLRPSGDTKTSVSDDAALIAAEILTLAPQRCLRTIGVLAQTNEGIDAVADALARAEIPYVAAGTGFYRTREVRDLAALLACVARPDDRVALLEVLRGPWVGASDRALLGLSTERGLLPLDEWLRGPAAALVDDEERADVERLASVLGALRRCADRIGPAGVLREAIRALELEETLLLLPRGEQRVANVRKLVALAAGEPSVHRMLELLEQRIDDGREEEAAVFSEDDDAVRLLTVHASKGLAFEVVFVPQLGPRPSPPGALLAFDRDAIPGAAGEPARHVLHVPAVDSGGARRVSLAQHRAIRRQRARERADRFRLAYVAVTRAREWLYFVGDHPPPRTKQTDTYSGSTAWVLRELEASRCPALAIRAVECAPAPERARAAPRRRVELPSDRVGTPAVRALPIATTALGDFAHCARRFELVHLLDLPERDRPAGSATAVPRDDGPAPMDPRAEGTLGHRVLELVPREAFGSAGAADAVRTILEREGPVPAPVAERIVSRVCAFLTGPYAARIRREGAALERERPFLLPVACGERTVVLKGTIDLLVRWPDGGVDVVDYKRARGPALDPHGLQLDVYALAARAASHEDARVRAGVVFLGGAAAEPKWRAPRPDDEVRAELAALGARLVEARWQERFPRAPQSTCRRIHCGYERLCWPRGADQLGLFG